jgi:hypothetical protein
LAKQLSIGGQYPGAARFDGGHNQSGSALFAACPGIGRRCRSFRSVGAVIEQLSPIKTLQQASAFGTQAGNDIDMVIVKRTKTTPSATIVHCV